MLYIRFLRQQDADEAGGYDDVIWNPELYFDYSYEEEWFNDPLVKDMIQDIDKTTVLAPNCLQSPVLGQIAPMLLSGGVRTLIVMLKEPNLIVNASRCGDNCSKWILKIAEQQDIHIVLGHFMIFYKGEDFYKPMNAIIENDGRVIHTVKDYEYAVADFSSANII